MTAWTKLAYGSIVATVMLGAGGVIYFIQSERPATSIVTLEQVVAVVEGTLEHKAVLAPWPLTTNGSTSAGWGATTNVDGTERWSFMAGYSTIPLFGSINPRQAMRETLPQVQGMVTQFLSAVDYSPLTVTGLWATLQIGDGVSNWTIGCAADGSPVYGNNVGSSLSSQTLAEVWRVLDALYITERTMPAVSNVTSVSFHPMSYERATTNLFLGVIVGYYNVLYDDVYIEPDPNFTLLPIGNDVEEVLANNTFTFDLVKTNWITASNAIALNGDYERLYGYPENGYLYYNHSASMWGDDYRMVDYSEYNFTPNTDTNKAKGWRRWQDYTLSLPSLPSGVLVSVTCVSKAVFDGEFVGVDIAVTNHTTLSTNLCSTNVSFMGLSTGVFTTVSVAPNHSVYDFQDVSIPETLTGNWALEYNFYETNALPDYYEYTIFLGQPNNRYRATAYTEPGFPKARFHWTFKYRGAP